MKRCASDNWMVKVMGRHIPCALEVMKEFEVGQGFKKGFLKALASELLLTG